VLQTLTVPFPSAAAAQAGIRRDNAIAAAVPEAAFKNLLRELFAIRAPSIPCLRNMSEVMPGGIIAGASQRGKPFERLLC
jgi:hypothetical protein